jgi:hypothetical protein
MGRGRRRRSRRRELERRAEKLLRKAPERRSTEGADEYAERLRPWFQQRMGGGTDAEELWGVLSSMVWVEQDTDRRSYSRRAREILDGAPRPLSVETPSEYAERAHAVVMEHADREGGPELVLEVQRLMSEEVQAREQTRQELIAQGKYPVAQVVQLPHDVSAMLTKQAAVLIDDNRVNLDRLLEDYARRVASGSLGSAARPLRGGYPIGGSVVVFAWIPSQRAFYLWEHGELPGENDQPVFHEDELN